MSNFPDIFDLRTTIEGCLPRHFTYACGKLGPARTFLTLVSMRIFGQRGYRRVISELKEGLATQLEWLWEEKPSPAAFCKSRKKLTLTHCETALRAVYDQCSMARQHPEVTYRGLSVIAIDGTRLALPDSNELAEHFGRPTNKTDSDMVPMAGLIVMWDVSSQQPIDFRLTPYRHSEPDVAQEMFDALPPQSLLITDRGFPSYRLFDDLHHREQPFLMRVSKTHNAEIRAFSTGNERDVVVEMARPKAVASADVRQESHRLRLIKVALPNGGDAILVTNLLASDQHDAAELGRLYTTRWRIETAFREMKVWHALETFSAQHVLGIYQEVTAAFVFALLVAELEAKVRFEKAELTAKDPEKPLPEIRYNRRMIADAVVGLLVASTAGRERVLAHLDHCMEMLWRFREKRRPRPSTPRTRKSPSPGNRSGKAKGKG